MADSAAPQRASHRELLALAVPATLALAADPLLSLVDTALVGRLGAVPLAALGVNVAVFTAVFVGFNFLTYGTTAEVARLRGAGRPEDAARHALQALWLATGLGVAVLVGVQAGAPAILQIMGATGEVADPALTYLRIRAFAAVPVLVVAVGHGAFRGLKDTRTPLVISVATNAANAAVSYVLIYPVGLGIAGAAWGTLLAQTGGAVAFLAFARGRFPTPDLRIDPTAMRAIAVISRDLFLRTASIIGALAVTTAVATRMGVQAVAAHQVVRELWTTMTLVLDGFAIAGQALVGTAIGAARPEVATADARRLVRWGLVSGCAIGLVFLVLQGVLPRLFTTDAAVLAEADAVWILVAAIQPVGGVVFVLDGVLMGAGDFRFLLWSTALAALGGLAPVSIVALVLGWGLVGIWWGMALMMLIRLALTVARLRSGRWAHRA